ncbi:MAG: hypothetical protein KKF50_04585 [Nanoarchaeota archaeon]|nr:hypothetical protein [Nanoarchaeota archaeon]
MNSRGAMTVPKLVAIILAIVVLVMLVFGVTHLKPLYNRVGDMFDSVLYFFGMGDDGGRGECSNDIKVSSYDDGGTLLDIVGVPKDERESAFFIICDDGTCGVDFSSGEDYQIKDGRFESSWDGEVWGSKEDYLFWRNAKDTKEDWEVYNGVLDLMEKELEKGEFKKIYDERVTKSFWLYGNGEGVGDAYYAYWESGVWYFYSGSNPIDRETQPMMSIEQAISKFYEVVGKGNDDEVYYVEKLPVLKTIEYLSAGGTPENIFDENKKVLDRQLKSGEITQEQYDEEINSGWKPINFLIGGKNYELDNTDERDRLAIEVEKIVKRLAEEAKMTEEEISNLRAVVNGGEVPAGDFIYTMNLEMAKGYPKIVLTNGTREYYLEFDNDVKTLRESPEVHLRHYPLELTDNKPNQAFKPREIDYKLPKNEWDKFYKLNLIEDFIRTKCR